MIGWAELIENQMPLVNLTTAKDVEPFSIQSIPEWLDFLQTERSLTKVFCYNKRTIQAAISDISGNTKPGYWLRYPPMELVY